MITLYRLRINAKLDMASFPMDGPKSAGIQVTASLFAKRLAHVSIPVHLLPQFAQSIRGSMLPPNLPFELELRFRPFKLPLQPLQKLLAVKNSPHLRRIHFRKVILLGVRCGYILGIPKHEVKLASFQLIPLQFLGT